MVLLKGLTSAVAVGGALLAGGVGATPQQQTPEPRINADSLIQALGLPAEVKADLNKLGDYLVSQEQLRTQAIDLQQQLASASGRVFDQLSPEQARQLRLALARQGGYGYMGSHMGWGMLGAGANSYCSTGSPMWGGGRMNSRMGYGMGYGMGGMNHGMGRGYRP